MHEDHKQIRQMTWIIWLRFLRVCWSFSFVDCSRGETGNCLIPGNESNECLIRCWWAEKDFLMVYLWAVRAGRVGADLSHRWAVFKRLRWCLGRAKGLLEVNQAGRASTSTYINKQKRNRTSVEVEIIHNYMNKQQRIQQTSFRSTFQAIEALSAEGDGQKSSAGGYAPPAPPAPSHPGEGIFLQWSAKWRWWRFWWFQSWPEGPLGFQKMKEIFFFWRMDDVFLCGTSISVFETAALKSVYHPEKLGFSQIPSYKWFADANQGPNLRSIMDLERIPDLEYSLWNSRHFWWDENQQRQGLALRQAKRQEAPALKWRGALPQSEMWTASWYLKDSWLRFFTMSIGKYGPVGQNPKEVFNTFFGKQRGFSPIEIWYLSLAWVCFFACSFLKLNTTGKFAYGFCPWSGGLPSSSPGFIHPRNLARFDPFQEEQPDWRWCVGVFVCLFVCLFFS